MRGPAPSEHYAPRVVPHRGLGFAVYLGGFEVAYGFRTEGEAEDAARSIGQAVSAIRAEERSLVLTAVRNAGIATRELPPVVADRVVRAAEELMQGGRIR